LQGDGDQGEGAHGDGDSGEADSGHGDGDVGDGDSGDGDGDSSDDGAGDGRSGDEDAGNGDSSDNDAGAGDLPPEPPTTSVPSQGSARRLDIGSWNIEWFGDTGEGPKDDTRQADNAREVLLGAAMDLWGVAEIVDGDAFRSVVARMPGYRVLLADDALVTDGAAHYDDGEQKVGLVYREDLVTVRSAKAVLAKDDYLFAGRPPLEVHVDITIAGNKDSLIVLVMHAKALADQEAWQRRSEAAAALKSYLDDTYPSESVLVVGDFNDTLKGSILAGEDSPYRPFVEDSSDYYFVSSEIPGGTGSTVGRSTVIDHHLATNELRARYVPNSVQVFRADKYVDSYGSSTSDHYPVLSHYEW
jgi:endonuclease/exonuclease/phosphatase family metal-dependent hydrolase